MEKSLYTPGVYFTETDNTFQPIVDQSVGAAFVGQTHKGRAFVPTFVSSISDFYRKFGSLNQYSYLPYAVKSYLEAGVPSYVTRVLGTDGYMASVLVFKTGSTVVGVLHPTDRATSSTPPFSLSTFTTHSSGSFTLRLSGSAQSPSVTYTSMSFDPTLSSYIGRNFGYSPNVGGSTSTGNSAYMFLNFPTQQSASLAATAGNPQWTMSSGQIRMPSVPNTALNCC